MDLGLADRVYLVTGGSKGLGFATAQALVGEGANVVISARSAESVDSALAVLGNHQARGVAADNADPGTPQRLIDVATKEFGRLDGALISVGGPPATGALDATDEQWQAAFETVFLGAVRTARAVAAHLTDGAIGLVLSTSVKSPLDGLAISNGLRPGLAMWAKGLADELGPRGIRVLSFMPGRVLTDRMRQLAPDQRARDAVAASIPLRRMGEPEEFGRVAAFALSPAASYLTGCVLPVDGGALRSL
jgi:3-oxoacyl-[acyl-carrier protein] reductase